MISFQAFRQTDGTPIYLQIIRYIQQGLAAGTIQDGDELPSRRVVSALLAVNPNTVQKAFRLLEDEGLVTSRAGAKSFIQATPEQIAALRRELLETVNSLDEPGREILVRRYYYDQKPRQIALALGMTVKQVDNSLYRSKRLLREKLSEAWGGAE